MKTLVSLMLIGLFGIAHGDIPFEDADADQDGVVTAEEITSAVEGYEDETVLGELDWDTADTDEDGTLSKDEYEAVINASE